jgi:hypothetical protein
MKEDKNKVRGHRVRHLFGLFFVTKLKIGLETMGRENEREEARPGSTGSKTTKVSKRTRERERERPSESNCQLKTILCRKCFQQKKVESKGDLLA